MPPDSPFLLVIDPNPEGAARVNGLLKDSGIDVHILHADNPAEAERLIREFAPFLVYYLPEAQGLFPVGEAARLSAELGTFLAIALHDEGQALLTEASGSTAAIGVGDEAQLPVIAHRLAGLGQASHVEDRMRAHGEELEKRLDLLLNSTREPIAYFHEGLHVAANDAYLELLGAGSLDELLMVSLLEILQRDGTDLKALVRGFSRNEYPEAGERFVLRTPGGDSLPVDLTFAPVRYEGEDCVQLLVRPVSAEPAADSAAAAAATAPEPSPEPAPAPPPEPQPPVTPQEATPAAGAGASPGPDGAPGGNVDVGTDTDPLTGMLWRAPFMQRLNQRLADLPEDQRAALYFLAMDDAHRKMDELSAADLDRYQQSTAGEILSCLEAEDDVCRFGDSTFAVFTIRQDPAQLKRLGEKLRAGIERQAQEHPDAPLPKSCSVGYVLLDNQHHDPEHTLNKARSTCRLAAEEGNRAMRYKPARAAGVSEDEETQWRERIRYALDNEDFYTVQHSIMNLDGDFEGMVENRTFMHEEDGDVPAESYLGAAERNQLASQIDRLVVPGLLRAVAGGEDNQIIEISGNSLQDFSFPAWFQRTLQETRVAGKRVILQWPAWAARQQTKAARRLIEELSPLAVRFSVSGFDADQRTLDLLKSLKLEYVTLDEALTRDLQTDPTQLDSIRDIVRAAESMQVKVIASNVPTSSDLATLWRGGVKLVSGDFVQETPRVIGQ
jgi:diguanylate cyclase (GGDEF)-like protein